VKNTQAGRDFSAEIVRYLKQTRSLAEIADLLEVNRSYITMVNKGQRNLTIEHLIKLERKLKESVIVLTMESILRTKSKKVQLKYNDLLHLLRQSADLRASTIPIYKRQRNA